MQITNHHIAKFWELLKADGIEKDLYHNLHDVCDPNQYMIDVLGLDVDNDTMETYAEFENALTRSAMFRKSWMGWKYYEFPTGAKLPRLEIKWKNDQLTDNAIATFIPLQGMAFEKAVETVRDWYRDRSMIFARCYGDFDVRFHNSTKLIAIRKRTGSSNQWTTVIIFNFKNY